MALLVVPIIGLVCVCIYRIGLRSCGHTLSIVPQCLHGQKIVGGREYGEAICMYIHMNRRTIKNGGWVITQRIEDGSTVTVAT